MRSRLASVVLPLIRSDVCQGYRDKCQRSADKPVEPVAIPHTEPEDEGTDGGDSRTNTEGHDKYVPHSGHEDYNN